MEEKWVWFFSPSVKNFQKNICCSIYFMNLIFIHLSQSIIPVVRYTCMWKYFFYFIFTYLRNFVIYCLKWKLYTACVLVNCSNLLYSHWDSHFYVVKFLLPFISLIQKPQKMQNICIRATNSVHDLCKLRAKCILDIQN